MGKLQRVFAALCGALALGLGIWGAELAVSSPDREPVLLETDPGISQTAQSLLDSLCDGNPEALSQYLVGNPSLSAPTGGSAESRVWEAYVGSISYRLEGDVYGTNQGPAMDVTMEALDLEKLCRRVQTLVPQALERQIASAQDIHELYDSHNSYRQEVIDRALLESLEQALAEGPETKETPLTLHFSYQGTWLVQPEKALVVFLSGNITGA